MLLQTRAVRTAAVASAWFCQVGTLPTLCRRTAVLPGQRMQVPDPPYGHLGRELLPETAHRAAQRHDAVERGYARALSARASC